MIEENEDARGILHPRGGVAVTVVKRHQEASDENSSDKARESINQPVTIGSD